MFYKLASDIQSEIIVYLKYDDLLRLLKVYPILKIKESLWNNVIKILKSRLSINENRNRKLLSKPNLDYYDMYLQYLQNKNYVIWKSYISNFSYYDADDDYNFHNYKHNNYFWSTSLDEVINNLAYTICSYYLIFKFQEFKTIKDIDIDDSLFDGDYKDEDEFLKYIITSCHYTKESFMNFKTVSCISNKNFVIIDDKEVFISVSNFIKDKISLFKNLKHISFNIKMDKLCKVYIETEKLSIDKCIKKHIKVKNLGSEDEVSTYSYKLKKAIENRDY